ncbi:IS4 family transposase [Segetibacter sp. 3557_3]|uniref:IS4 family transposase n=1 Tax=Segetibacter sp. 3557_3 TaxID=2547429 RepID=UPI001058CBFD|nr:IS4 family transposase [Segetibacter sp. 3557_3]TDH21267.1 IS4 family transposase [Segetibacter sp. 3557_3]
MTINFQGAIDKRLEMRCRSFSSSLLRNFTSSIQRVSKDRADQIGNYRFLHNHRVTEGDLVKEQQNRCCRLSEDKVVVCIHDSSEANLFTHKDRLKPNSGLGFIDAEKGGVGFKMHLSLVLDAKSYYPYGMANIKLWQRDKKVDLTHEESKRSPIEQKESYKWIEGSQCSNVTLQKAASIIHVQDREGDIYEQIADFKNDNREFYIIRSRCERKIEENGWLWEQLSASPMIGQYQLKIDGDSHGRKARESLMEVRVLTTRVKRPAKKIKSLPEYSAVITAIETREVNPPKDSDPLIWRLLTNCKIEDLADALQAIQWYTARWFIEELFRLVKKENFDIESSELESGWALRKLTLMAIDTAVKLFQFHTAIQLEEGETVESVSSFSADEFSCLTAIGLQMQGKTEKQKNPYKTRSAKWVMWILARLGGWKGYQSQRKPGLTTILEGLTKFYDIYKGWVIEKDVCTR